MTGNDGGETEAGGTAPGVGKVVEGRWLKESRLMWVTCNVLLVREAALIISYPKLNFPSFVPAWVFSSPYFAFPS